MAVETATSTAPSWVTQALEWVGLRWPEGDAGRISAAGDAWLTFSQTLKTQLATATAAAQLAWSPPNRGGIVDPFRAWWTGATGPGTTLVHAADAAESIGTALRGLSVQITLLRAAFIGQLAMLVAALVGAGLLIAGSAGLGTVAVAGGGSYLVNRVRQAMIRRLELAVATVATLLVVGLLRRATQELEPVTVRDTRTRRETDPKPGDGPGPGPLPIPWRPDTDDDEPKCRARPDTFLPRPPILVGNPDPRTVGGYILRIQQQLDGSSRVVTIDGVMNDALPPSQRLGTPQYELQIARQAIGLPAGAYDACHAYGPGFGSEAAAGMSLCPTAINQSPGAMFDLEERLRNLYRQTDQQGGWVELSVTSRTFPSSAWPDPLSASQLPSPMNQPAGANLMSRVDYTATVCQPGRVLDVYRFGLSIDPPTLRGGVYQIPSSATVYGRLPP